MSQIIDLVVRPIDLAPNTRVPPCPATLILEDRTRNVLVALQTPIKMSIHDERPVHSQGIHASSPTLLLGVQRVPKPHLSTGISETQMPEALPQLKVGGKVQDPTLANWPSQSMSQIDK